MNVRPLEENEAINLVSINNTGNDSALLFVTATGLSHNIFDATELIRRFFEEKKFHVFNTQRQGEENKIIKNSKIIGDDFVFETKVSLYRPSTKKGDPRFWIYKCNQYVGANDIVSLVVFNDTLYVFNLTKLKPIKDVITNGGFTSHILSNVNSAAKELLSLLKEISKKELIGEVNADTAIGRAVEKALGIKINSSPNPDYKGIEIKSSRSEKKTTKSNLFSKVPDWEISRYKNSKELLDRFGYQRGNDIKLYCTVSSRTANSQGLFLSVDDELLHKKYKSISVEEPVCVWKLCTLHQCLLDKHRETFWVTAKAVKSAKTEAFRLISVTHTSRPSTYNFDTMLQNGNITVDLLIKKIPGRDAAKDKGYLFKVNEKMREQLFLGKQSVYNLE